MLRTNMSQAWVGGRLSHTKKILYWEDGRTEEVVRGVQPWAAGGERGAQPDGDQLHRQAPPSVSKCALHTL
jgi:hypothetical protein